MNRRQALKKMLAIGGAALLVPFAAFSERARAASPSAGVQKVDKKTARYRDHPEDGKMCMNCRHFIPPKGMGSMMEGTGKGMGTMDGSMGMGSMMAGGCEVVAGPISPMGYCRFYLEKS